MSDAVLVENGVPRGAIHLSAAANDVHRFVAEEIQRYVELLSGGRLPIVTEPEAAPEGALILVGGPRANQAVSGLVDRGVLDLGGLTAEGAYLLKSVDLDGRGCLVAAGRDDTGTMYAAYELLERLGVVFQLTGDILPERKATLELPELDVAAAPARTFRGVHVWHAYTWNMGMEDARAQVLLAGMFATGLTAEDGNVIVERDEAAAARWCRRAAEQGNGDGQFCLAGLYITAPASSRTMRKRCAGCGWPAVRASACLRAGSATCTTRAGWASRRIRRRPMPGIGGPPTRPIPPSKGTAWSSPPAAGPYRPSPAGDADHCHPPD